MVYWNCGPLSTVVSFTLHIVSSLLTSIYVTKDTQSLYAEMMLFVCAHLVQVNTSYKGSHYHEHW